MIITESAAERLKAILDREQKKDTFVRVYVAGHSCNGPTYALTLDMVKGKEDRASNSNGIDLVYEKSLEDDLKEIRLDYIKTEYGEGFVVINPNPACGSGCACH